MVAGPPPFSRFGDLLDLPLTRDPVLWARACLRPFGLGGYNSLYTYIDLLEGRRAGRKTEHPTTKDQAPQAGRTPGSAGLRPGVAARILRVWLDSGSRRFLGLSLDCSKEQDYREFSNLDLHLPEHPLRKWEPRFGKPILP